MEGLKGKRTVAEISREHKISQTLYHRWQDRFLEEGKEGLVNGGRSRVEWKRALEMAIDRGFPEGVRGRGLKLISDNGFTAYFQIFYEGYGNLKCRAYIHLL